MEDEQFSKLVELIHEHDFYWRMIDQQSRWDRGNEEEKQIKEMLKSYLWEDIEPLVKDDWRKERVRRLF